MTQLALTLALVLLPGLYAWLDGRRLLRERDDPVLAELWMAYGARGIKVLIGSWAAVLVVAAFHAPWALVLAGLGLAAGRYPARRAVFEETWSLAGYLAHSIRLILALVGPWMLLVAGPILIVAYASVANWIIPGLIVTLLVWGLAWPRTIVDLLRARTFDDVALLDRFAPVIAKADCKPPRILRAGPRGGLFVNAFAIPRPSDPIVLISDDLVANLSPEEVTGIFAHEVAHLEEASAKQWTVRTLSPAVLALIFSALYVAIGPDHMLAPWVLIAWPLLSVMVLASAMRRAQEHETESDLRAVELTGDAEALARALIRLHALARQPRRLPADFERSASHPSLASRLKALSKVSGHESGEETRRATATQPTGPRPIRFADDSTRAFSLEADHLVWLSGLPADEVLSSDELWRTATRAESLRYSELMELRLVTKGRGGRELLAIDQRGRKHRARVRPEDSEAIQCALDRIDDQLVRPVASPLSRFAGSTILRLVAAAAMLAGLLPPWNWALTAAAFVALIWPTRAAALAAACAGMLGMASNLSALAPCLMDASLEPYQDFFAMQGGLCLVLVLVAVLRRRLQVVSPEEYDRRVVVALVALSVVAAFFGLGLMWGWPHRIDVFYWLESGPTALLLVVAAGLAIASSEPSRKPRSSAG